MAATLAQYRARFAEHASVADETVELYLDDANTDVTSTEFGDRLTRAQLYYAAHFVQDNEGGSSGTPGAVESRTVGSITTAFSGIAESESDSVWGSLMTTKYGREYRRLCEMSMFGFRSFD